MQTLKDIEEAVERLSAQDLARFRTWFEEREAEAFDRAIERDVASGKLDALAERALADHAAGRTRPR